MEFEKFKTIVANLMVIIFGTVGMVYETWVASVLWGWAVTPIFDIAVPPFAAMFILNCLVSLLTGHMSIKQTLSRTEEVARAFMFCVYRPSAVLLFAWIARAVW